MGISWKWWGRRAWGLSYLSETLYISKRPSAAFSAQRCRRASISFAGKGWKPGETVALTLNIVSPNPATVTLHVQAGRDGKPFELTGEAARGVLPNSTETKIVVTANARAWRTMLELRSSEGAELEIRRCAVAMLKLLQKESPAFFSDFEIYQAEDRREAARIVYHKV